MKPIGVQGMEPPPHTRGPPGLDGAALVEGGITPAYAGTTTAAWSDARAVSGSPPHTRGPQGIGLPLFRHVGDHPRIRGDHRDCMSRPFCVMGSPPHTRGPRTGRRHRVLPRGITPAYAGTTSTGARTSRIWRDHPRIRWDHALTLIAVERGVGSPPHTRGPRRHQVFPPAEPGITPAYAGTTDPLRTCHPHEWDHPRIRGDHYTLVALCTTLLGSPPHTRGPLARRTVLRQHHGITPAYAGDHLGSGMGAGDTSGSPPHTRGPPGSRASRQSKKSRTDGPIRIF